MTRDALNVFKHKMKCDILENLSTTTMTKSWHFKIQRNPKTKSMLISSHGLIRNVVYIAQHFAWPIWPRCTLNIGLWCSLCLSSRNANIIDTPTKAIALSRLKWSLKPITYLSHINLTMMFTLAKWVKQKKRYPLFTR